MNTFLVLETKRMNGIKYSENILRGASVYTADASYFGSCDQKLCLSHIDYQIFFIILLQKIRLLKKWSSDPRGMFSLYLIPFIL